MNASSGESPDAVAGESAFWLPRLDRAGQVLLLALAFAVVLACFTSWTLLVFMREDMAIAAAIVGALSVARTYVLVLGRDAWNLRTTWDWIVGRFVSSAVYAAAMMLAAHLATQLTIVVAFEVLREPSLRAYVYHVNDFLLYLTFLTGLVGCWFWPWHAFSDPDVEDRSDLPAIRTRQPWRIALFGLLLATNIPALFAHILYGHWHYGGHAIGGVVLCMAAWQATLAAHEADGRDWPWHRWLGEYFAAVVKLVIVAAVAGIVAWLVLYYGRLIWMTPGSIPFRNPLLFDRLWHVSFVAPAAMAGVVAALAGVMVGTILLVPRPMLHVREEDAPTETPLWPSLEANAMLLGWGLGLVLLKEEIQAALLPWILWDRALFQNLSVAYYMRNEFVLPIALTAFIAAAYLRAHRQALFVDATGKPPTAYSLFTLAIDFVQAMLLFVLGVAPALFLQGLVSLVLPSWGAGGAEVALVLWLVMLTTLALAAFGLYVWWSEDDRDPAAPPRRQFSLASLLLAVTGLSFALAVAYYSVEWGLLLAGVLFVAGLRAHRMVAAMESRKVSPTTQLVFRCYKQSFLWSLAIFAIALVAYVISLWLAGSLFELRQSHATLPSTWAQSYGGLFALWAGTWAGWMLLRIHEPAAEESGAEGRDCGPAR